MKALLLVLALLLTATVSDARPRRGYYRGYGWTQPVYMNWDDAVAFGNQILADKQRSLGDVAREYRARKAQEQNSPTNNPQPTTTNIPATVCPPTK